MALPVSRHATEVLSASAAIETNGPEEIELARQEDAGAQEDAIDEDNETFHLSKSVTRRLYISHFLSTWNSRSFEFAAVLFLAAIFPGTLLFLSIYALVRSASAIAFAPLLGRTIDTKNRLQVVRFSISERFFISITSLYYTEQEELWTTSN